MRARNNFPWHEVVVSLIARLHYRKSYEVVLLKEKRNHSPGGEFNESFVYDHFKAKLNNFRR